MAKAKAAADVAPQELETPVPAVPVGHVWKCGNGDVQRPDGSVISVRGAHALDVPGIYVCGDESVEAV